MRRKICAVVVGGLEKLETVAESVVKSHYVGDKTFPRQESTLFCGCCMKLSDRARSDRLHLPINMDEIS